MIHCRILSDVCPGRSSMSPTALMITVARMFGMSSAAGLPVSASISEQ
jgi:hypothetical protein